MNLQTRLLMSISAFVLFVIGVAFSFVSQEILEAVHGRAEPATVVVMQLLGAAYLAFAFLNWLSRGATLGGIYGRPLSMPNLLHFSIVAITLIKLAQVWPEPLLIGAAAVSAVLAAWFGLVVFNPPAAKRD